jgi:transglutaminase-like putative cysteine protease
MFENRIQTTIRHAALSIQLGLALPCLAQTVSEMDAISSRYPGEQAIVVNDKMDIIIDIKNGKYAITEYVEKDVLLPQPPSPYLATDKVYINNFRQITNIEAKTLIPDGNKYKAINVEKFVDQKDGASYVFYDETMAKTFVYPSLQKGAITSLRYSYNVSDIYVLGSFFFKWASPCTFSQITIKADKRAKICYKLYNTQNTNIDFKFKQKGNYNIYTWKAIDIKGIRSEDRAPDSRYYYPHIVYYIDNANPLDSINKQNMGLNGLYHYYYSFIQKLNQHTDSTMLQTVNKITEGAVNEEEKVKRIFYWVQDNIRYIAFEEGMQGFIPEQATQVYNKRYGDCKGMASIINYMLHLAGIQSYLTWVGSRDIPYKYTDIPSGMVDNHMIVTYYNQNKQAVFLDATDYHLPYGMPTSMIQGKQALVSIDSSNYNIENVPVIPGSENIYSDSICISIKDKTVFGEGFLLLSGYNKGNLTYHLDNYDKEQLKDNLINILPKGNNKFFLDTFDMQNLRNRENPLCISYKFRVNNYYREVGNEIYVNMNMNRKHDNDLFDSLKREVPVEFAYNSVVKSVTVFEIPEGYTVSYLPKNVAAASDKFAFDISYKIEGNKVLQIKNIQSNVLLLQPNEFSSWNNPVEKLSKAYREVLILKKL